MRYYATYINDTILFSELASFQIWYRDSLSIQEVPLHMFKNTNKSTTDPDITISSYVFVDPQKNYCAYYRNFTDSASSFKSYLDVDSIKYYGGWNFYEKNNFPYDSREILNDTMLNNISYSRLKLYRKSETTTQHFILYYKKNIRHLIGFMKQIEDQIGCSITRIDTYINNNLTTSIEVQFVKNKLSSDESKVFDKWKVK